jgi:hypothetical protein
LRWLAPAKSTGAGDESCQTTLNQTLHTIGGQPHLLPCNPSVDQHAVSRNRNLPYGPAGAFYIASAASEEIAWEARKLVSRASGWQPTGFYSYLDYTIVGKWPPMLKEFGPRIRRTVLILWSLGPSCHAAISIKASGRVENYICNLSLHSIELAT